MMTDPPFSRKLAGVRRAATGAPIRPAKIQNDPVYLYVTVDTELTSDSKLYDEYGRALSCPVCNTSLASAATMKLLYSNCCGRAVCNSCADKVRGPCSTPGCKGQLTSRSWSTEPIDKQRYNAEVRCRMRLSSLIGLKRESFESKEAYDDYLEECQDIIYDLTHGNDSVKRSAEERTEDLRHKYSTLINRARDQVMRTLQSEAMAAAAISAATTVTSHMDNAPAFIDKPDITLGRALPQILSKPSSYAGFRLDEAAIKKASAMLDTCESRDILEALDGIFIW